HLTRHAVVPEPRPEPERPEAALDRIGEQGDAPRAGGKISQTERFADAGHFDRVALAEDTNRRRGERRVALALADRIAQVERRSTERVHHTRDPVRVAEDASF